MTESSFHVAFRHTSVFPPQPHPLAYETKSGKKLPKSATTCIPTLEVMIQVLLYATLMRFSLYGKSAVIFKRTGLLN